MNMFKRIIDFFQAEKIEYWHRNRTIDIIASEKGLDIDVIKKEIDSIIQNNGRVEAVIALRRRFHVPLSSAWRFVDKI